MQLLWAAWRVCVDANSALCDTDYPQAIGYFLDVHVALVTSGAGKSMASVMQHKLAPEQSAATFTISNEMHSVVSMLWHNANASNLPIVKLLQKGLPRPRSVRYIRPQVIRCASCSRSKQIARELIINWFLGRYSHRKEIAGPERRIEAWGKSFDELSSMLLKLPSRSLYYVIAECLAAVTISSPPLHIRAVGTVEGFAQYVQSATTSAGIALRSPTVRLKQCVAQLHKKPSKKKRVSKAAAAADTVCTQVQQWPCNNATLHGQVKMSMQNLGLPRINKFACHSCALLHVKLGKPPRAAKAHMGVSIDIFDPSKAVCNKCNDSAHIVTLTGNVTRAMIGKKQEVVSLCGFCGAFCNNLHVHGLTLCCASCAVAQRTLMLESALPCPCNLPDAVPSGAVFVALQNGKHVLVRACTKHKPLARAAQLAEVATWARVFNA